MSLTIGIYHGDEDWVLKGIGQDLAKSLAKFNNLKVKSTDQVFKGVRLPVDYHIFVQQGQLNSNARGKPDNVPDNAICLYTHLDIGNFRPDILTKCRAVIFNSSIQLSMAIANGYNPSNAYLKPHAVDSSLHQILPSSHELVLRAVNQLKASDKNILLRSAVGFCGRYWEKNTYTRRKNYQKIKKVAYMLAESGIPVILLGPGWEQLFLEKHPKIIIINTKYKYYPVFYNFMKVFVSLSIHEGGPLPVLESMCCGCYPIVTNTGFAFDVLRDKRDGILISPFSDSSYCYELIKNTFFSEYWNPLSIRKRASKFSFDALASLIVEITSK